MNSRSEKYKQKKKKKALWPYLIFLVGFLITIYPFVSQSYYRVVSRDTIRDYIEEVGKIPSPEIEERLALARAYNATLDPKRISDPFSDLEKKGYAEYARMLEVKEKIGYIDVPKIDEELPIYAGTSEEILSKGAGYLEGTSLPVGGESTHTVITAHTGYSKAKLFTDLVKVEKGDVFYIHVLDQVLAYEVDQILVVEPTDFEHVLVEEGKDYATLLTCTPYGVNSHRLLVRGHRIPYDGKSSKNHKGPRSLMAWYLGGGIVLLAVIGGGIYLYLRRKKKRMA